MHIYYIDLFADYNCLSATNNSNEQQQQQQHTTATATGSSSSSSRAAAAAAAATGSSLSSLHRTLVGYLTISFASLEANQTVEKWYKLELATAASQSTSFLGTNGRSGGGGGGGGSGTLSGRYDASSSSIASHGSFSMPGGQHMQPVTYSSSALTTESFSKDSVTIRVKIKYQHLDILPLTAYRRLIHVRYHIPIKGETIIAIFLIYFAFFSTPALAT